MFRQSRDNLLKNVYKCKIYLNTIDQYGHGGALLRAVSRPGDMRITSPLQAIQGCVFKATGTRFDGYISDMLG